MMLLPPLACLEAGKNLDSLMPGLWLSAETYKTVSHEPRASQVSHDTVPRLRQPEPVVS